MMKILRSLLVVSLITFVLAGCVWEDGDDKKGEPNPSDPAPTGGEEDKGEGDKGEGDKGEAGAGEIVSFKIKNGLRTPVIIMIGEESTTLESSKCHSVVSTDAANVKVQFESERIICGDESNKCMLSGNSKITSDGGEVEVRRFSMDLVAEGEELNCGSEDSDSEDSEE